MRPEVILMQRLRIIDHTGLRPHERCSIKIRSIYSVMDFRFDLLCQQGLAEVSEALRRHIYIELNRRDELILQLLQVSIAENREKLR
jgi:hypothetical protein